MLQGAEARGFERDFVLRLFDAQNSAQSPCRDRRAVVNGAARKLQTQFGCTESFEGVNRLEGRCFVFVLILNFQLKLSTASLAGRVRRSANMQVAQIAERAPVFFTHAPGEIRIVQVLVPRRLRHILQYRQPVLYRPLPVWRHLFPPWQNIISDVRLLLWRHLLPHASALAHLLLLLRWQLPETPLVLPQPLSFVRRQISWTNWRIWRPVSSAKRTRGAGGWPVCS